MQRALLVIGILSMLISCASSDVLGARAQANALDIYDRYAFELEKAEDAYLREDVIELSRVVSSLLSYELPEAPNYRPYFFESYLKFKRGDIRGSAEMLRDFKCMLRVDSGISHCSGDASNSGISRLCADTMCSEIFFSYYENPSRETLAMVAKYWSYVDDLETKLGGDVGECSE